MDSTRILIIGLGEIGRANAEYILNHKPYNGSLVLHGHDVREEAVFDCSQAGLIQNDSPIENFNGYNYYLVCVSTHSQKEMTEPDTLGITNVLRQIEEESEPGTLVCIESTIPVGFCDLWGDQLYTKNIHLVHCPERYYAPEKDQGHGINQVRVLGHFEACCRQPGMRFYQNMLGIPIACVPDIRIAEASKLMENAHRFVKIALMEEAWLWAKAIGLDPDALIAAINTKWNSDQLVPMQGIGGHCLPKDSHMFWTACPSYANLVGTAKLVDKYYYEAAVQKTQAI